MGVSVSVSVSQVVVSMVLAMSSDVFGITRGSSELVVADVVVSAGVSVSALVVVLSAVERTVVSWYVVESTGGIVELVGMETVEDSEDSLLAAGSV